MRAVIAEVTPYVNAHNEDRWDFDPQAETALLFLGLLIFTKTPLRHVWLAGESPISGVAAGSIRPFIPL
jgi:hypothetical protein